MPKFSYRMVCACTCREGNKSNGQLGHAPRIWAMGAETSSVWRQISWESRFKLQTPCLAAVSCVDIDISRFRRSLVLRTSRRDLGIDVGLVGGLGHEFTAGGTDSHNDAAVRSGQEINGRKAEGALRDADRGQWASLARRPQAPSRHPPQVLRPPICEQAAIRSDQCRQPPGRKFSASESGAG